MQNFSLICFVLCNIPNLYTPSFLAMRPQSASLILLVIGNRTEKAQSAEDLTRFIKTDGNIKKQCGEAGACSSPASRNTLDLALSLWGWPDVCHHAAVAKSSRHPQRLCEGEERCGCCLCVSTAFSVQMTALY